MEYLLAQLMDLRDAGPYPGEDFFRVQFTGNGSTHWLNLSPQQFDMIITALTEE